MYHDGVYIAAPVLGPQLPAPFVGATNLASNDRGDGDVALHYKPQEAFTRRLLALFKRQRKLLAVTPARNLKRLPKAMKLGFPKGYQAGYKACKELTVNHNPLPVYLAALSQTSLLRILRICHGGPQAQQKHRIEATQHGYGVSYADLEMWAPWTARPSAS